MQITVGKYVETHPLSIHLRTHHYSGVIMGTIASQITSLTIVYVYPCADQRKYQSSASLAFVREIHRWPVNPPHKGPVMRKMLSFDDVIIMAKRNVGLSDSYTIVIFQSLENECKLYIYVYFSKNIIYVKVTTYYLIWSKLWEVICFHIHYHTYIYILLNFRIPSNVYTYVLLDLQEPSPRSRYWRQ